jgi:hypothetical protein
MEPSDYKPFAPEAHEQNNAELKSQVDALKRSIEVLRAMPVQEPKPGFDERVIGRIREAELAERARKQIIAAPMPLWQHVVQVGLGAAAAAMVLLVIGVPGMFGDDTQLAGSGGSPVNMVAPTEGDLLPALADHNARFDSLAPSCQHRASALGPGTPQPVAVSPRCRVAGRPSRPLPAIPGRNRPRAGRDQL